MRKITVILLALGLLLVSAAAAEETALTGVWYAEINGRPIQMELVSPMMERLDGNVNLSSKLGKGAYLYTIFLQ